MKQILTLTFLMLIGITHGQNLLRPTVTPQDIGVEALYELDGQVLIDMLQSESIDIEVGPLSFTGEREVVTYPVQMASGESDTYEVTVFTGPDGHLSYFTDGTVFMYHASEHQALSLHEEGLYALEIDTSDRGFQCAALSHPEAVGAETDVNTLSDKVIEVYLEADYALYRDKGGRTQTIQWLHNVFEVVKYMYSRENINTKVSSIYIWDRQDSYSQRSSVEALQQFRNSPHDKTGDLRHLVALGPNGLGGVAWLNTLCTSYNYAYSNVQSNFTTFPNYSWTVMVMTHEMGHNIGSPHTQSCAWGPNKDRALDNCYNTEGNCAPGPAPTNGGTVMSYCHLTSYGINLNNGFGSEPGNLIRARVNAASCLGSSGNQCITPSIGIGGTTETTATITWGGTGATNYYLRYRETNVNSWTEQATNQTSYTITGLRASTQYYIQLRSDCESQYNTTGSFKTKDAPEGCGQFVNTGFEDGMGMFTQSRDDDFNWTRKAGRTTSSGTGPNGAAEGRYYLYTESSSPNYPNQRAVLVSKCFTVGAGQKLSFDYHMYGSSMGILSIIQDGRVIWSKKGDQGNKWNKATVDLKESTGSVLIIEATTGQRYRSDIAIDDIRVIGGAGDGGDDGGNDGGGEVELCEAKKGSSVFEWIQSVSFGNTTITTGNNNGYVSRELDINLGNQQVELIPGYVRTPCLDIHWVVYRGGNNGWEEILARTGNRPQKASLDLTAGKYRVIMSYNRIGGACDEILWGEIEDYELR